MIRIAIEEQYLDPRDLNELTTLVRDGAQVVALPQRIDEMAYRDILRGASVAIGSPRPSWIVGTQLNLVQLAGVGCEDYVGVGLETQSQLAGFEAPITGGF